MFRKAWFRALLVLSILASLVAAPLFVSAQETVSITSPAEGATLSGTVTVTGMTPTEGYDRWDLLLFPNGDDSNLATIGVAGGTDLGALSYDLDTTQYPDGEYVLALRAVRADKNYSESPRVGVTIANAGAAPAEQAAVVEEEEVVAVEEEAAPVAETAAPVNGFDAAKDGIKASGVVTVTGYADTPGFEKWQLDVVPFGVEDDAIFVTLDDAAGEFSYTLDSTEFPDGDHQLRLRVVNDTGNYTEYFADLTIANAATGPVVEEVAATETTTETVEAEVPAVVEAPAAAVSANGFDLEEGASLSGTVTITGYADDPDFDKWDLFLLPSGVEADKTFLAQGTESGEFSVTVDTTNFPNGDHVLSLRIVRATDGNYTEILLPFTIANAE